MKGNNSIVKTLYIYNPLSNTYKSVSSIIIAKELSKSNKVALFDFDIFSNINNILKETKTIDLLSNIDKINNDNFISLQFNVLINENIDYKLLSKWLLDIKNVFANNYDFLIINSSSSNGIINNTIFNIIDDVLVTTNLIKENSKEILELLIEIKEKNENNFKTHFLAITDSNDANNNANSFLKMKKNLSNLLLDTFIKINDTNNEQSILNDKSILNSYSNIIKVLYNL